MSNVLLEAKGLKMHFPIKAGVIRRTVGYVKAVDGITLNVYKGESLGIVGESGSGKSTLGRMLLRLLDPTEGEVYFNGEQISNLSNRKMRPYRRDMSNTLSFFQHIY